MKTHRKQKKKIAQKDQKVKEILDAVLDVYRFIGPDRPDTYYRSALRLEFALRGLPFSYDVAVPEYNREESFTTTYRLDFVCYHSVLVRLKETHQLRETEESQMKRDMKAAGLRTGILLDFNADRLTYTCFVLKNNRSRTSRELSIVTG